MAIEQGLGAGGTPEEPVVEDTTRMQEIPELPATPGITEFDDGSAVVGEYEEEGEPVADVPFDGNLADVIEEDSLCLYLPILLTRLKMTLRRVKTGKIHTKRD